jgi:hypothetical protein
MRAFVGIGISIGVLAGIWTQLSVTLGLITWVAFVAWALYFATGTKRAGIQTTLASTLSGVFWAWLVSLVLPVASFPGALAVLVGVLALVLCLEAAFGPLSFIPGAFIGAAVLFGTSFAVGHTVLALVLGVAFGFVSDLLGARIQAAVDGRRRGVDAGARPATAETV